jgi:phosphoribosylglycinamide formyltransferase-1
LETRIVVLASGRGTDFQAIADHRTMGIFKGVEISGLICNHADAPVINRAQSVGVPSFVIKGIIGTRFPNESAKEEARIAFDKSCIKVIDELQADLVVLAGFDQIVSKTFVEACKFKILNIHPAYDLKRFGGKNMVGRKVHELVLSSGAGYSGCTIHYVTNDIDGGPVLLKKRVDVSKIDTPESLERKILQLEHLAYPEAIQLVADGRVRVDESGKRCFVDRFSDGWDIDWDSRQQRYIAIVQDKV